MLAIISMLGNVQREFCGNDLQQVLVGKNSGHSFRVEIQCAKFEPVGRKISWQRKDGAYYIFINGRRVLFSDGLAKPLPDPIAFLGKRTTEIRRFEVTVDGHRWRVPPSLTFDLLNLNLNTPSFGDQGQAWLSKRGDRLVLKQSGGDGGGGYSAYFVFRPKGPVERRIYFESNLLETRKG